MYLRRLGPEKGDFVIRLYTRCYLFRMGGFTPYENFSTLIINYLQIHLLCGSKPFSGLLAKMAKARARTAVASTRRGRSGRQGTLWRINAIKSKRGRLQAMPSRTHGRPWPCEWVARSAGMERSGRFRRAQPEPDGYCNSNGCACEAEERSWTEVPLRQLKKAGQHTLLSLY